MKTMTEMKTIGYVVDCREDIEEEKVTETKSFGTKVLDAMVKATEPFDRPVTTVNRGFWHCIEGQLEIVVGYADLAVTAANQVVKLGYKAIDMVDHTTVTVWK